jgi:hypothetical protein
MVKYCLLAGLVVLSLQKKQFMKKAIKANYILWNRKKNG